MIEICVNRLGLQVEGLTKMSIRGSSDIVNPPIALNRLTICVALSLLTASVASSATVIDISPVSGGSQTLLSWRLTGDIVSASGQSAQADGTVGAITGGFNNLFSWNFAADWLRNISAYNGDIYIKTYLVSDAGMTTVNDRSGSRSIQIGAITLHAESGYMGLFNHSTSGFISLGYGQNYYDQMNWNMGSSPTRYSQYSSDSLGYNAPAILSYTAGTDSYVLPVAFSSFNQGTYSSTYSDMIVNVVPEPSTYALFGLGGLALLAANRRRKTMP